MSKRKLALAILFILGVSLLNAAVLISASNHESQLSIEAFDQQPVPVTRYTFFYRKCNSDTSRCDILDRNSTCYEVNGNC